MYDVTHISIPPAERSLQIQHTFVFALHNRGEQNDREDPETRGFGPSPLTAPFILKYLSHENDERQLQWRHGENDKPSVQAEHGRRQTIERKLQNRICDDSEGPKPSGGGCG